MRIEKHFYINGFPLSLALKQTFEATRKMTYNVTVILVFSSSNNVA